MDEAVLEKERSLEEIVSRCGAALVAFSGGVDSTYLLSVVAGVLGAGNTEGAAGVSGTGKPQAAGGAPGTAKVLAVTIESPVVPPREINDACKIAKQLGVEHLLVESDDLESEAFRTNPPDRCYHCKKDIFSRLLDVARERGFPCVFEASNCDDTADYRPGLVALRELGIRSPLIEAGLRKDEIRALSRKRGLPTWDKPSLACLATRIPYHESVTREKLEQVRLAEEYVCSVGFTSCRLRHHGSIARIEVPASEIDRLLDAATRRRIVERLKGLGFSYVVVDLEGYRSGSMNETLDRQ